MLSKGKGLCTKVLRTTPNNTNNNQGSNHSSSSSSSSSSGEKEKGGELSPIVLRYKFGRVPHSTMMTTEGAAGEMGGWIVGELVAVKVGRRHSRE